MKGVDCRADNWNTYSPPNNSPFSFGKNLADSICFSTCNVVRC